MEQQHTAGSLANVIGARVDGSPDVKCTGCSTLKDAKSGELTFMNSAKHVKLWKESLASIGIVPNGVSVPEHDATSRTLLWVDNVDLAIAKILSIFCGSSDLPDVGVHPSAVVFESAQIGKDVRIGPNVVIADGAEIGEGVSIHANCRIGKQAKIGAGSLLFSGVVVGQDCSVGQDCIIHGNVVIGTDGFGYCPSEDQSHLVKIPHIGNVEIGDSVEIGANSCIDRGKFASTTIGSGTKIDNLVQIGHNCKIGHNCALSATSAISGSVTIGNWVQLGGNVGIAPHCVIGDGAKIGAKSGVMHDIPAGEECLGYPACQAKDALRQWSSTRKLPRILAEFLRNSKEH